MKYFIFLFLTAASLTSWGQNFIGVKGGLNLTYNSFNDLYKMKNSRSGLSGGLTYESFIKKNTSLGVDLLYNQRGFTEEIIFTDNQGNPTGQKATTEYNFNYLSLPVKVGIYTKDRTRLGLNLGLVPSYLIKSETILPTYELDGQIYNAKIINTTDRVSKFDFAGLVEFTFNFQLKDNYWFLGAISYQHSFTDFTNKDYFNDRNMNHYGLILSIGFRYRLSR